MTAPSFSFNQSILYNVGMLIFSKHNFQNWSVVSDFFFFFTLYQTFSNFSKHKITKGYILFKEVDSMSPT